MIVRPPPPSRPKRLTLGAASSSIGGVVMTVVIVILWLGVENACATAWKQGNSSWCTPIRALYDLLK